ncbi:hypothetical protein HMPREF3156_02283 [Neisseria sp. HMSC06F02]|nr:hypothetical protein HMPREF3156_02283 [Neisseria sp. HMSC06F02]
MLGNLGENVDNFSDDLRPGKCRGRLKILRHKGFICFSDFRRKSGMWKIAGSRRKQLFPYVFMSNTVMPASLSETYRLSFPCCFCYICRLFLSNRSVP